MIDTAPYLPYPFHDREQFMAIQRAARQMRQHDRAFAAAYDVALQREAARLVAPRPGLLARLFGRGDKETV